MNQLNKYAVAFVAIFIDQFGTCELWFTLGLALGKDTNEKMNKDCNIARQEIGEKEGKNFRMYFGYRTTGTIYFCFLECLMRNYSLTFRII